MAKKSQLLDQFDSTANININIYIYAVKLLSGPRLGVFHSYYWAMFVFLKRLFVKKHYKIGVSAIFSKKRGPKIFNSY